MPSNVIVNSILFPRSVARDDEAPKLRVWTAALKAVAIARIYIGDTMKPIAVPEALPYILDFDPLPCSQYSLL
jgi:hypothetical protein